MTRSEPRRPRFILAPSVALALGVCACASGPSVRKEDSFESLRAELGRVRAENERLASRISRLEAIESVRRSARGASPEGASTDAGTNPDRATASSGGDAGSSSFVSSVRRRPAQTATPDVRDSSSNEVDEEGELPALAVIKLEPSRPPVEEPVDVEVREPDLAELPGAAPEPVDPRILEAEFEQGLSSLKTGNLKGGAERLEAFAETHGEHPRADNALYFAGLGWMGLEELPRAAATFEGLIARYPAGDAVVDAHLKLAECRLRLGDRREALALLSRIVSRYPGTAAAVQARQRLSSLSPEG